MSHGNARLIFLARMDMVQQVAAGWPQAEVARQFRVSRVTVAKWVRRYREEGESGLHDRSCRPHFHSRLTPPAITEAIATLRRTMSWGPHHVAWALGVACSTVYAVLRRLGLHRLSWLHRTTKEVVRYEWKRPGELVHLDVNDAGPYPDWRGQARLAPICPNGHGPRYQPWRGVRLSPCVCR